jgi:hypothetical protein
VPPLPLWSHHRCPSAPKPSLSIEAKRCSTMPRPSPAVEVTLTLLCFSAPPKAEHHHVRLCLREIAAIARERAGASNRSETEANAPPLPGGQVRRRQRAFRRQPLLRYRAGAI